MRTGWSVLLLLLGAAMAQQSALRVDARGTGLTDTLLEMRGDTAGTDSWSNGTQRAHAMLLPACAPVHPTATRVLLLRDVAGTDAVLLRAEDGLSADALSRWARGEESTERVLLFGGRRFMRTVTSFDSARAEDTMKPWQDLFAENGELQITKGAGGKYPHHRGVFLGWNKVERAGATHDFWHCRAAVSIRHRRFLEAGCAAGRAAARLVTEQEWCLADEKPVVRETRSLTAFAGRNFRALDVTIALQALDGPLKLGGDAHHAGFHVRAADAVTATEKETLVTLPPDARPLGNDVFADLTWGAMSFKLEARTFTFLLIEHPANPRGAVLSARPYGRMGFMPLASLDPAEPLLLRWRLLVFEGKAPAAEELAKHAATFRAPPKVELVP